MKPMEINGHEIVVLECYTQESIDAIDNGTGTSLEWGAFSWEHNEGPKCIKQGPIFDNYVDALQDAINYVQGLGSEGKAA